MVLYLIRMGCFFKVTLNTSWKDQKSISFFLKAASMQTIFQANSIDILLGEGSVYTKYFIVSGT